MGQPKSSAATTKAKPKGKAGKKPSTKKPKPPTGPAPEAVPAKEILAWEDDPFAVTAPAPVNATPIRRPVPDLTGGPLQVSISAPAPEPRHYAPGTPEFRYWTAAETLRRGVDLWTSVLPAGTQWFSTVGPALRVDLDLGSELNAYYTRAGLEFYHASVGGRIVYSGESPDVVSHELGHAVLDALRPQLFDAASIEAAAFHESFGDVSALLTALQLPTVRERTLLQTEGRLYRNSRLSRVAEQLGWAIRQSHAEAVDHDSLRNAVNSFFYTDPAKLPPDAPASQLSSRPHSFSRIFTAAFFEALGGMLHVLGATEANLLRVTREGAQLLVEAIRSAPVVPAYFSQVAAAMIDADRARFASKYRDALKSAFVRHGVLSLSAAAAKTIKPPAMAGAAPTTAAGKQELPLAQIVASAYGLGIETLLVRAPSEPVRFQAFGAAPDTGDLAPHAHAEDAQFFLEDLLRRGRVDLGGHGDESARVAHPFAKKTHVLVPEKHGLALQRVRFDCGFDCE